MKLDIRIISRIALYDFKMVWRDRSLLIWVFIMPIVFMFIFGNAFRGSSGVRPKAALTVDNRDSGFLAGNFMESLREEHLAITDTVGTGTDPLRLLIIPPDFTRKVLSRESVVLTLKRKENANMEASQTVSVSVFKALVRVVSGLIEIEKDYLDRGVEGIAIRDSELQGSLWMTTEEGGKPADSLRVGMDSIMRGDHFVLTETSAAGKETEIPTGFQGSVPGILVMFVLMSMVFSGTGITEERKGGLLRRLGTTPAGGCDVVVGKLLGRIYVALLQIAFLFGVGIFIFNISAGNSPLALVLLMVVFAFAVGSFGIMFGSLFKSQEKLEGFAIITALVMSALGGCWWPLEVVPRPFKIIAHLIPTGWAMEGIHRIISFGYGFDSIILHLAALLAFGLVFIIIAARKLRWSG